MGYTRGRKTSARPGQSGGLPTGFQIVMNPKDVAELSDFCQNRLPRQATRTLAQVYGRIGTQLTKDIRRSGYSETGAASVGRTPIGNQSAMALKYGHLQDKLYRKYGAKKFGAYIRIKFRKEGWFRAYWHEQGSFKSGGRYAKTYRHRDSYGGGFGPVQRLKKRRFTGALPARGPLGKSFQRISPDWMRSVTADAIGKAITAAKRKGG